MFYSIEFWVFSFKFEFVVWSAKYRCTFYLQKYMMKLTLLIYLTFSEQIVFFNLMNLRWISVNVNFLRRISALKILLLWNWVSSVTHCWLYSDYSPLFIQGWWEESNWNMTMRIGIVEVFLCQFLEKNFAFKKFSLRNLDSSSIF